MPLGRGSDEEPCVVTAGRFRRRDPVREEMESPGVEQQVLVLDDLDERPLTGADRPAGGLEPRRDGRVVEVDGPARDGGAGEEDPGLLERLPDGGDPEAHPSRMHAELGAGGGVVAPVAAAEQLRRPVAGVDREHVGAAHELDRDVAPQHEHLQLRRVTDEHHGGGLPRGHHRNASESGPAEGSLASRTSTPVYVASREFPASHARAPNYPGDVDPRHALPGVDRVLAALSGLPHELLVACARDAIAAARERMPLDQAEGAVSVDEVIADARHRVEQLQDRFLRPVINATGVIVHTNLGRAPVGDDALAAARAIGRGYSNLEYHMDDGERGSRHEHAGALLARACGAEAGLVVNNNAAAVLLSLAALARGREVVVSRGELVEIGGGFRVPEIMAESGCRLVEVGTTNRTHRRDYERAVGSASDASLVLTVHQSHYRIVGFTAAVDVRA